MIRTLERNVRCRPTASVIKSTQVGWREAPLNVAQHFGVLSEIDLTVTLGPQVDMNIYEPAFFSALQTKLYLADWRSSSRDLFHPINNFDENHFSSQNVILNDSMNTEWNPFSLLTNKKPLLTSANTDNCSLSHDLRINCKK